MGAELKETLIFDSLELALRWKELYKDEITQYPTSLAGPEPIADGEVA